MPGDPFAPVRQGQSAAEVLTSAARVNLWTEGSLAYRRGKLGSTFDSPLSPLTENEIFVRNDTGADRNRFDIVAFVDPVFTRDDNVDAFLDRQQSSMKAIEPAWPDHFLSWGVLQQSCRSGKYARVRVGGIAVAKVNFANADASTGHKYATVKDSEYGYLDSAPCGPAKILWKESGTGQKWCKLWLGAPMPAGFVGRTSGTISAASGSNFPYTLGSGTIDIAKRSGSTYVDASWNLTVYNTVPVEVAASVLVVGSYDDVGTPIVTVEPCEEA